MTPVLLQPRPALPGATDADRDVLVVDPHRRPRDGDLVLAATAAVAVRAPFRDGVALLVVDDLRFDHVVLGVIAAVHGER